VAVADVADGPEVFPQPAVLLRVEDADELVGADQDVARLGRLGLDHQAQLGMTALQIGCLAANAPARRFYESLGGRLIGERLFDEEGVMLPEVVYEWADIETLVVKVRPEVEERQ